MFKKIYKEVGKGENFTAAIIQSQSGYDHPLITKWVDRQQEHYMSKERDFSRISTIIWGLRNQTLIDLFTRWKLSIGEIVLEENNDRDWLKKLSRRKMNFVEQKAMQGLMKAFEHDLENDRINWAYELSWDDLNMYWEQDIDKDNDLEVAQFLGLKKVPDIEGFIIDDEKFDISEVEFCVKCGEPTVIAKMKDEWEQDNDEPFKESDYYCQHCTGHYKYNFKHCKINPHKDPKGILARLV